MKRHDTKFAPAPRVDLHTIRLENEFLIRHELFNHVTMVLPSILLILNRERQAVYVNLSLLELLGVQTDENILGKRPGEILSCIHSEEDPNGCGTTEFCRECGAVNALVTSQRENISIMEECRVTTVTGDAYEFRVWASPLEVDRRDYTAFTIIDIRHEKRREILEQTFFHDVNNILTGLVGYSELLPTVSSEEEVSESINSIRMAAKELASEVDTQRKLLAAEDDRLAIHLERDLSSIQVMKELKEAAERWWPLSNTVIDRASEDFKMTTDKSLLYRVIFNMLKNGEEASKGEDPVTLGCFRKGSTGIFRVHSHSYMPRPVQLQVFQRSFSTRGKGRGIGAYSMKLFGERYLKGNIWFTTDKADGTTFYFALPLIYSGEEL